MDKMDRLLYRLPSEAPEPEFARRVAQYVQTRHHRNMRLRQGMAILLAMIGAWLSSPLLGTIQNTMDLSDSGLAVIQNVLESAWSGVSALLQYAWSGASGMQTSFASSITVSVGVGLAALAVSALLALDQLLPRHPFEISKWAEGETA